MKHLARAAGLLFCVAAALLASQRIAGAADALPRAAPTIAPPEPVPTGWTFSASAYAWAAGLDGRVRTLPPLPAVDISMSIGDVLQNLDGALMGLIEARNGPWMVMADLIYSKVSPGKNFAVAGFNGAANLDSQAFIGLAAVGYRLFEHQRVSVDGFVGARLWALDNTLTVTVPGVGSVEYGKSKSWVDGVVGGRVKLHLTDKLFASVIGSVGGLAADVEWDIYAGLNYAFTERWSAFAGYRALHVDYKSSDFLYDATQHGPVLGVAVRF